MATLGAANTGQVGRIPVRNLWLLMLYASDLFQYRGRRNIAVEENPDDIPDLVAEILTRLVERRLRRNLSFGYQPKDEVLSRVRGRINLLYTERHQLLDMGRIACRFEEFLVDTPRNRYVRAALEKIAKIVQRSDLAYRCRALAARLRRMGVSGQKPARNELSADQFGRHDTDDRQMIAAAQLAFDLALPTEETGPRSLFMPDREESWVRRLFEKAVAGFYDVVLSGSGWRVHPGKRLRWPVERETDGIENLLPSMQTDIVLDHVDKGRRIVVDTKFTSITTKAQYREETLRSGYLYQMYAYLRSQEDNGDPLAVDAAGLLLHPALGEMVDGSVVIQGHEIRFATVDLGAAAGKIRKQLLQVVGLAETLYA